MTRFILLLLALVLASGHATAQPVKDVIEGFGLVGEWKSDCSDPRSRYERWSVAPSGAVELHNGIGQNSVAYSVVAAERSNPDEVRVRIRTVAHGNETTRDLVLIRKDGKIRNWSVLRQDGEFAIKDGLAMHSDEETPWLTRCR